MSQRFTLMPYSNKVDKIIESNETFTVDIFQTRLNLKTSLSG